MVSLPNRYDRSINDQGAVEPCFGDPIGLEVGQVDVESTDDPQRGHDNQLVQVGVSLPLDVKVFVRSCRIWFYCRR